MSDVMGRLLTMSAQAGALIFFVLLISRLTKRSTSPRLRYALWLLPAARFLLPFTFESSLSLMNLMPNGGGITPYLSSSEGREIAGSIEAAVTPASVQFTPAPAQPVTAPDIVPRSAAQAVPGLEIILFWIWVSGMAVVLAYILYINIGFYLNIRKNREHIACTCKLPVYLVPRLASPCLYGCFRPAVLVNGAVLRKEETLALVLRHELCHYKAGDQWWALLRNLCCVVHWFNPLVWWAAYRSRSDCELACDARVMKGLNQAECERYGMALLAIIRPESKKSSPMNTATTMTGGKHEMKERIRNIGKRPKTLWFVALAVVLCIAAAALAACSDRAAETASAPGVIATITLSPKAAIESSPSPTASPAAAVTDDNPYTFGRWTSRYTAWPNDGKPSEFNGVMIDGSRAGNVLSVSLAYKQEDGHYCNKIALSTEQGTWEAEFPSSSESGPQYRYAEVQCSDLDTDGTDEIIVFYSYGSSGGEGDLHIYRIEPTGLVKIMACYDTMLGQQPWMAAGAAQPLPVNEHCVGVYVFLGDDYRLALRVYHDYRANAPTSDDLAQLFSEYRLGENGWEVIREYVTITLSDRLIAMRETLAGIATLDDEYCVYASLEGAGADLTGSGQVLDRVSCATVQKNDESAAGYLVIEIQLYGQPRKLAALYQRDGSIGYNVTIFDLDGDGADEILVSLGYSVYRNGQPEFRCSEMHLLKYINGDFKDALSVISNAPSVAGEYRDTLFMPPNTAGLAIPDESWDNSFSWAERVVLNGKYAIRLTHTYHDAIAGYSYLVFKDGAWKLELQSVEASD